MGSVPPAEGDRRQPQQQPHVVMIPYPAQGHVTPMLQLAKLLHTRGFHVTFVNNEFLAATEGRSMLSTWCPQAEVLEHEAVGLFLTHSGWNSTIESICGGVPMVCWPFFAEQQTNCRYKRTEWGIGMEIGNDVRRGEVKALIREAMEGEKGRDMRRRVTELKGSAVAAAKLNGRSMRNVDRFIDEVLLA
ncbi:UDP-glycosyltransferase 85A7 [Zea mays]|uniref:UDP-glycosyltransferase 85A7 n=1 Tax=Zea mays TaxID=4577 RepID=A0A1D6KPB0_MAIZE|nr:UDP-glycosyltransferase 85A7 [Zea mays]